MSGNTCQYSQCGKSAFTDYGLKVFKFPFQNVNRCRKWINNSGNAALTKMELKDLKHKVICEKHFEPRAFTYGKRKRLLNNAVPIDYAAINNVTLIYEQSQASCCNDNNETVIVSHSYDTNDNSNNEFLQEFIVLPVTESPRKKRKFYDINENDTETVKKLKTTILKYKNALKQKQTVINNLRKVIQRQKKIKSMRKRDLYEALLTAVYASSESKTLVGMQLLHKRGQHWTKNERQFALELHCKSPSAYKFLCSKHIILPKLSTVIKWRGRTNHITFYNEALHQKSCNTSDNIN